jgi:hypothetical protein
METSRLLSIGGPRKKRSTQRGVTISEALWTRKQPFRGHRRLILQQKAPQNRVRLADEESCPMYFGKEAWVTLLMSLLFGNTK